MSDSDSSKWDAQAYVGKSGKTYGPYPVRDLRGYVEAGNFGLDDLACLDGKNWVKLSEVLDATKAPDAAEAPEPAKAKMEHDAAEVPEPAEVKMEQVSMESKPAEKAPSAKPESKQREDAPEVEELDLEFSARGPLFVAPSMNLWMLLGFLFCALAYVSLFFPWYFFSGSGTENGASVWKNGLSKACDHLGFIPLFGVVLSVCGSFFKPLFPFSPLPMGVAALGSLLPLFFLDAKSVNIVGTTLSISLGWGVWVCFGASFLATAFLCLNVWVDTREQALPS